MPERIERPIDAGPLAVPEPEDAVEASVVLEMGELAPPDHGGAEVLVDPADELHLVATKERLVLGVRVVDPTQRRTAVTGDQARAVQTSGSVGALLVGGDPHEGVDAGHRHCALGGTEPVAELEFDGSHRQPPVTGASRDFSVWAIIASARCSTICIFSTASSARLVHSSSPSAPTS